MSMEKSEKKRFPENSFWFIRTVFLCLFFGKSRTLAVPAGKVPFSNEVEAHTVAIVILFLPV